MTDLIAPSRRRLHRRLMTQTLDATSLPPSIRHPRIFETFDALAPGEAFVLSNDHYPLPLLYQFQVERANQFDWSVLEAGPTYRVMISKRDAATPRGVDEYLSWDHNRLDAILDMVIDLFEAAQVEEARTRFAEFACGLDRHIDLEENIVFPVFDAQSPHAGPTRVMCMEHVHIREALRSIEAALQKSDANAFDEGIETLVSVLGEHNAKEEGILYPAIDRMTDAAGRADLVRRMQTAPP